MVRLELLAGLFILALELPELLLGNPGLLRWSALRRKEEESRVLSGRDAARLESGNGRKGLGES